MLFVQIKCARFFDRFKSRDDITTYLCVTYDCDINYMKNKSEYIVRVLILNEPIVLEIRSILLQNLVVTYS